MFNLNIFINKNVIKHDCSMLIPLYNGMTAEEQDHVIKSLNEF